MAMKFPGPEGLNMKRCYSRWCFYDPSGELVYWAEEHEVTIPAERNFWGRRTNPMREKRLFSGGYAALLKSQNEHNAWLKTIIWRPLHPGGGLEGRILAPLLWETEGWIRPIGSLNLRTLSIPYLKGRHAALRMWERFLVDCGRFFKDPYARPGCTSGFFEYFYGKWKEGGAVDYPNKLLAARAETLFLAWDKARTFHDIVEELIPLTRVADEQRDNYIQGEWNWPKKFGPDHLEPDRLPKGFLARLAAAERRFWAAFEDAAAFEDIRP